MKLHLRLALISCAVALLATGLTGALLIRSARSEASAQLLQRQQLLAQNRAFALGDNLELALRELIRLSNMAEIDLTDNDVQPEAQLLAHAHRNSALFNIGLRIHDAAGNCLWSEPESQSCKGGESVAGQPWFEGGLKAKGAIVVAEGAPSPRIDILVPILGKKASKGTVVGLLRGIIDPRTDKIIAPALLDALPPGTEAALVSTHGKLIYPVSLQRSAGWERVLAEAPLQAGAFSFEEDGDRWLFAYAPVQHAGWGLAFRWRWSQLDDSLLRQRKLLWQILALGGVLAVLLSLASSRWQVRPLERLVQERTAELEAAQRALLSQERLAAMGQAAAVISHELKNSLGALGMGVELIARDAAAAGLAKVHGQVREEVTRLRTLTDELLVFARSPEVEKQEHDLNQLVRKAADLCAEQAFSAGVRLDLQLAPGPLKLSCDGRRIQSVLVNLVINAIEAVAFQEGKEPADEKREKGAVRLTTQAVGGSVLASVDDSGPGLTSEAQGHLFEPFFTTKRNGTGLGLSTSQRFVGAHGGRIESARSESGGARFTVVLPALQEARA
jgi:signal transduction histidine kinase